VRMTLMVMVLCLHALAPQQAAKGGLLRREPLHPKAPSPGALLPCLLRRHTKLLMLRKVAGRGALRKSQVRHSGRQ
jgi:hypothetical protein